MPIQFPFFCFVLRLDIVFAVAIRFKLRLKRGFVFVASELVGRFDETLTLTFFGARIFGRSGSPGRPEVEF